MENQIAKSNSEPILLKISKIDDTNQKALTLFDHVKSNPVELDRITMDHETFPSIRKLVLTAGKGCVKLYLVMMIEETIRSMNIAEPSAEQVKEIAEELINDYPAMKAEDYKIFFTNYRKGRYGKDYHRFDISTIYQAMSVYSVERASAHEAALSKLKYLDMPKIGHETSMKKVYDKIVIEEMKKEERTTGITERDKHRRAASECYANEFQIWCNENEKFMDDENAVVEFAKIKPFNQQYIENYIKKHL